MKLLIEFIDLKLGGAEDGTASLDYDRPNTFQWDGSSMWWMGTSRNITILGGVLPEMLTELEHNEPPEPDGQPWKGMFEAGEREMEKLKEELRLSELEPVPSGLNDLDAVLTPGDNAAETVALLDALTRLRSAK